MTQHGKRVLRDQIYDFELYTFSETINGVVSGNDTFMVHLHILCKLAEIKGHIMNI